MLCKRSWCGFLRSRTPQSCNAPRFRFAPSRSWLSPHGLSAPSAIVQRTSIPLRSISVVAFATWFIGSVLNRATHLDSAPLHLGRGFRHLVYRLRPQSCNAPRFRSAPSWSWLSPHRKEKRGLPGNASTSREPSLLFPALLNCCTQKNRRPRSYHVCKNSDF